MMTSLFVTLLHGFLLVLTATQPPNGLNPVVESQLREQVAHYLRWKHFWSHLYSRPECRKSVTRVRTLLFEKDIIVLDADLCLALRFGVSGDSLQLPASELSNIAGETNDQAERRFLLAMEKRESIVVRNGKAEMIREVVEIGHYERSEFEFAFPPLDPPDSIRTQSIPADLEQFKAAVQQQLAKESRKGELEVVVPHYGPFDPAVYVLVRSGEANLGYCDFVPMGNGVWLWSGKLWPDYPARRKRIESNELCRITIEDPEQ